jgi:hypothetical protein
MSNEQIENQTENQTKNQTNNQTKNQNNRLKFREEWTNYVNYIFEKIKTKSISKYDENKLIDLVNDFKILTILAIKEIDSDELETNKCYAKANVGLDCSSTILNNLLIFVIMNIDKTKLYKLYEILNIDDINESMLSESYREILNNDDSKLEYFLL